MGIKELRLTFPVALLLTFFSQNSEAQINLELKGIIVSADSMPVADASVIVKDTGDHIHAFFISKQNGSFIIKINVEKPGDYLLQVSHINYKSVLKKVFLDSISKVIPDFHFLLYPANNELKEVIVKTKLPSITVKHDTIEFDAKAFQTPETIKTEDLLKNIRGFVVDAKGGITYNGKAVEKILIEGDDLADKNYKLISKYLDASVIDKVQVLNNYEENRLLKETGKSDKIAINLTITEKFRNRLSGSIEAGGSFQKKYAANENIIYISPKFKTLLFSNYNNTGDSPDADTEYYFNQDENTAANTSNKGNYTGPIKPGAIPTPTLDDKYILNNNDGSNNLMNSWKIGKAVKIRTLAGYSICRNTHNDLGYNEISLPSIPKWTTATIENSSSKAKRVITQVSVKHDNLKNNTGSYLFSINGRADLNTYKSIASLAITDTLSEVLHATAWGYHFTGNETFKLKKSKIVMFDAGLTRENILQDFNSLTNRFLGYFFVDSSFSINTQKTTQVSDHTWLTVKWAGKKGKINYNYGFNTAFSHENISNDILNEDKNNAGNVIIQPKLTFEYKDSKYDAFANLDTKLFGRSILSAGISLGYGEEKMRNNDTVQHHASGLVKSFFEYRYNISEFKLLTAGCQFNIAPPPSQSFYGRGLLSGNSTILDGASILTDAKTRQVSISYLSNDIFSNSQLLINCILINAAKEYNAGYYLSPAFTKNNITPTGNNYQAILNIHTEKYYSRVKSKIILLFQGFQLKRNFIVNDILNKDISTSIRVQVKYVTAFKLPLNFETSCSMSHFENALSVNSQDFSKQAVWQYEGYGKVKINFSKKLYSNMIYGVYKLSQNEMFKTLDSYFIYKSDKKWTFSLTVHNLLNDKILKQRNIAANSINEYSFYVVERYLLGKISLSL